MRDDRSDFNIVTDKQKKRRYIGRPKHRWECKIRMDLKEIGVNLRNLINLRSCVNVALNLRIHYVI